VHKPWVRKLHIFKRARTLHRIDPAVISVYASAANPPRADICNQRSRDARQIGTITLVSGRITFGKLGKAFSKRVKRYPPRWLLKMVNSALLKAFLFREVVILPAERVIHPPAGLGKKEVKVMIITDCLSNSERNDHGFCPKGRQWRADRHSTCAPRLSLGKPLTAIYDCFSGPHLKQNNCKKPSGAIPRHV